MAQCALVHWPTIRRKFKEKADMHNPAWNLAVKTVSVLAIVLLLLGPALLLATDLGNALQSENGRNVTIAGSILGILALVIANLAYSRSVREIAATAESAHQLSQGAIFKDETTNAPANSLFGVSHYLEAKSAIVDRMAEGRFSENGIAVSDSDVLGRSLQNMADRLRESVQSPEEKHRSSLEIARLIGEISEAAACDLSVNAAVDSETTGPIAEAFNTMIGEIRSRVRTVKDTTLQIGTAAETAGETAEQAARGSLVQTSQMARTISSIENLTNQARKMGESSGSSAKIAADLLERTRTGRKAAADNIEAMRSIRLQFQDSAKRVKKLGERSQEIGQIVGMIDELSERTSLLAMNASLEATNGDVNGMAFANVVGEVERLADRAGRLTRQISDLTRTINAETRDVVSSIEETIHEVVVGSAFADKTGDALTHIEENAAKLKELIAATAESSGHQLKVTEDLTGTMNEISKLAELIQSGSGRAAESVRTIVHLSTEMRGSISPFKLPSDANLPAVESGSFLN